MALGPRKPSRLSQLPGSLHPWVGHLIGALSGAPGPTLAHCTPGLGTLTLALRQAPILPRHTVVLQRMGPCSSLACSLAKCFMSSTLRLVSFSLGASSSMDYGGGEETAGTILLRTSFLPI